MALIAILFIIWFIFLFIYPKRTLTIGFVAVGIGALLLYIFLAVLASYSNSNQPNSTGTYLASQTKINANQVVITNPGLKDNYGSYVLTGEIQNNSDYELSGLYLIIKAYDCPTNNITPDCLTIGEDDNVYVSVNIPAGQVRQINGTNSGGYVTSTNFVNVNLSNMPTVKNQFMWSYQITRAINI
jgi:hypothetical protein